MEMVEYELKSVKIFNYIFNNLKHLNKEELIIIRNTIAIILGKELDQGKESEAMNMIQDIRDKNYEETKHMTSGELMTHTKGRLKKME